ncbi:TonB-dependent receptor [Aliiglaciecola sp. M165]|uniref:TonB-dependent receptor n=1 Tax=Aliiglaciecola sp. M165 TaxID=2593649 RepID=UPI00163DC2C9|nr:TonB-dependent receptor [Aliiglaciecola sp. M165]
MNTNKKPFGHTLIAITLASLCGIPAIAYAQTDTPDTEDYEKIIVTAERRATNLQQTAASVSALGINDLKKRNIDDVEDLGISNTSLQVSFYQGEAQVFMRGIGTPITVGGTEGSTAIYKDGEFLSRAAASIPGFFDVQQVEVLKGPQGTLYGRNATAGSIVITSKKPTEEFTGEFKGTIGSYNRREISAAISGPIVEDVLLYRLAAQKNDRDGFTDLQTGDGNIIEAEDKDETFLRGVLEYRASEHLTFSLAADYYKADDRNNIFFSIADSFFVTDPTAHPFILPGGSGVEPAVTPLGVFTGSDVFPEGFRGINPFYIAQRGDLGPDTGQFVIDVGRSLADLFFGPNTYNGAITPGTPSKLRSRDDQYADTVPFNTPEIFGISGRFDYEKDDFTFSSLTAYRETKPENFTDFDLSTAFAGSQYRAEDQWQFIQEFQVASTLGEKLDWIAGLSYFEEENDIQNEYPIASTLAVMGVFLATGFDPIESLNLLPNFDNTAPCCTFELNGSLQTKAYSAFVDAVYQHTEKLTIRGGVRYSYEKRGGSNDLFTQAPIPQNDPFFNVTEFEDRSFASFTPKIGVNYQYSNNVFLYTNVSTGFKSGGYNIGSLQNENFDEEYVVSYEAGLRSDFFDNRFRFNATAFFYDYTDLQVQTVENNNIRVENATDAEISGLEISGFFRITDDFVVDYSATWLDTEILEFVTEDPARPALGPLNLAGNELPKAPESQFALGAQYTFDLNDAGYLVARVDWSFQDDIYFNQFNIEALSQESYDWFKASITWESLEDDWRVSLFADNISDEEVVTNGVFNGGVSGQLGLGNLAPPRTVGLSVEYLF